MIAPRVGRLLALALVVTSGACAKKDTAPPVATPSFSSAKTKVALQSPVDFTYRFDVAPGATIGGDYRVLMHVINADGTLMWTDDHDPPIPTSQWKPGQRIEYTRTRFIPKYPYLGEATVEMGLYRGDERLPMAGQETRDKRTYKVSTLQMLAESDNVFLIYKSGWHAMEFAPNNPMNGEWQWMQKTGVLSFKNPHKDATFYLESDAVPSNFDKPQQVTVWVGTAQVGAFAADSKDPVLRRLPITAAQFGAGDMAELRIEVDRTFIPALLPAATSHDTRELGIRVYHAFIEPK